MLTRIAVRGFKSLRDVTVDLPRMAVLFGPNAAGKSNLIDAIQALSRIGTMRTLADAFSDPLRGYPIESFTFPSGGLVELLSRESARFEIETDLTIGRESYRYRVAVAIEPGSGRLFVDDEHLARITTQGDPIGRAVIERIGDTFHIRRKSKPAHPRQEPSGANHTLLSDLRLTGIEYRAIESVRNELADWRTYYLDPRVAMRRAQPPSEVRDIGALGEHLAPFLYRLRAEQPKAFQAVARTVRALIPGVDDIDVELDRRQGTLDLRIRQDGVEYSSRIISEGTLRVLALCAIAANPWGGTLIAFEEPENGVHPRRLELIAELLGSLAIEQQRQVVVTTHSPLFCNAVLSIAQAAPTAMRLFHVRRDREGTVIIPFDLSGPLLDDQEILDALATGDANGLFECLWLRGLTDA